MKTQKITMNLFFVALFAALTGCGGGGGGGVSSDPNDNSAEQITGKFVLEVVDSAEYEFSEAVRVEIAAFVNPAINFVNDVVSLPSSNMAVIVQGCGKASAFYDVGSSRIVMCMELLENFFSQTFQQLDGDRELAKQAAEAAYIFVLYHEIAHAVDDKLQLPIAGNRESAADAIATVLSVEQGRPIYPVFTALLLLSSSGSSFAEVHPGGVDRGGDILCWTLGGAPTLAAEESFADLVQEFANVGRDCVGEYSQQKSAVLGWFPSLESLVVTVQTANPRASDLDSKINHIVADRLLEALANQRRSLYK